MCSVKSWSLKGKLKWLKLGKKTLSSFPFKLQQAKLLPKKDQINKLKHTKDHFVLHVHAGPQQRESGE